MTDYDRVIAALDAMAKQTEEFVRNLKLADDGPYAKQARNLREAVEIIHRMKGLDK